MKVEFLSEITSFLPLKFEYENYLITMQRFSCIFYVDGLVLSLKVVQVVSFNSANHKMYFLTAEKQSFFQKK